MARKPAPRDELEFLPAALEVQRTPPPRLARHILWSILLFFVLAVLWAAHGRVDIVAVAQGKVIPSGRVKRIQPAELGIVHAIHVSEGQQVAAGEVLIELDATLSRADRARLESELMAARLERARYQALLEAARAGFALDAAVIVWPEAAPARLVRSQQRLLTDELAEQRARLAALDAEIQRRQAERATSRERVGQLEATLPLVAERANALKQLMAKQLAPRQQYLELEQQRLDRRHALRVERSRLKELTAGIAEAERQKEAAGHEFRRTASANLAAREKAIAALEQEWIKASRRDERRRLSAPIAGVVQQLAVHTVGGVVQPAQELMRIVPEEKALEIEAWLPNKDIGFVKEGQIAEVKVDAFPFTKYGTLPATVHTLSDDAVQDDNLGLVYAVNVRLMRSSLEVEGKTVRLSPGMAVSVEVKTGKRRIIEFFLAPLLRYRQDSIRER